MTAKYFEQHKDRVVGLDVLRCIAIIWVMYQHGAAYIPQEKKINYYLLNPIFINGVSIFFVLSGFLIGGIVIKMVNSTSLTWIDLRNFWVRRWFRTIPTYLLVLTGLILFEHILGWRMGEFNWRFYFFSQNLFMQQPNFFAESWSLSVEEWFYLLFPVLCFTLYRIIRNKHNALIITVCIFLIVPLLSRLYQYKPIGDFMHDKDQFYNIVYFRLDSIMYGVLGAIIHFRYPEFWKRYKGHFLFIGLIFVILFKILYLYILSFFPLYFNIESIITLLFLPSLSLLITTKSIFLDRIFIFISVISYSLYLLHSSLITWHLMPLLDKYFGFSGMPLAKTLHIRYPLYWVLSFGLSYLLYTYFEAPVTKLRDKFTQ